MAKTLALLSLGGVIFLSLILFLYSYLYLDFGLIKLLASSKPDFEQLLKIMEFTEKNRGSLANFWLIWLFIWFVLTSGLITFSHKISNFRLLWAGIAITVIFATLSYPFLSHDLFSYLFYAKMVVYYHVNPYIVLPSAFQTQDLWLSFTHSIDRPFQYGQLFLFYISLPMIFLGTAKFLANFFTLKIFSGLIFFLSGWLLWKISDNDRKILIIWFFNPLLLVELLANTHNDLLMIGFIFLALWFQAQGKILFKWLSFLASILIKYPSILVSPAMLFNGRYRTYFFRFSALALFIFFQLYTGAIQAWYYTWFFMLLPFCRLKINSWIIINLILTLSLARYYPFLSSGFWGGHFILSDQRILTIILVLGIILIELGWHKYSIGALASR